MASAELARRIAARFPSASIVPVESNVGGILIDRASLVDVCALLRDDPGCRFDYPASLTAIDYLDYFEVVYQIRSLARGEDATLRCRVPRDDAQVPSVTPVWPGADFQEREIFDLMGITFPGHPNLRRILLWDEFVGHPLRKDFGLPAPLPPAVHEALEREGVAAANVIGHTPPGPRALDRRSS